MTISSLVPMPNSTERVLTGVIPADVTRVDVEPLSWPLAGSVILLLSAILWAAIIHLVIRLL